MSLRPKNLAAFVVALGLCPTLALAQTQSQKPDQKPTPKPAPKQKVDPDQTPKRRQAIVGKLTKLDVKRREIVVTPIGGGQVQIQQKPTQKAEAMTLVVGPKAAIGGRDAKPQPKGLKGVVPKPDQTPVEPKPEPKPSQTPVKPVKPGQDDKPVPAPKPRPDQKPSQDDTPVPAPKPRPDQKPTPVKPTPDQKVKPVQEQSGKVRPGQAGRTPLDDLKVGQLVRVVYVEREGRNVAQRIVILQD